MASNSEKDKDPKDSTTSEFRSKLPLRKKLIFSALVLVVFFGLLELVLLAFGVKPLTYEDDPHVGFASSIPLFVKDGAQMVTAANKIKWFNEQSFPRKKSGDAQRVFCLGGSTTFGRPFHDTTSFCGWLREYLPVADPGQDWELINGGGISYASYRVAALMEELADYDPDVFIIYSGHNEFLEHRTYGEMMDMPSTVRGLQAKFSHSRTYSLISRMLKGGDVAKDVTKLSAEVNTILDNSVGPESYKRDEDMKQKILAHYRFNLARMVDIARAADAEVVFVMPAGNLRNSAPFKSESDLGLTVEDFRRWESLLASAKIEFQNGDALAALAAIKLAAKIDPRHAHTQYLRAQILDALGRYEEANAAYELALENDICPLRMLAEMRAILNEVAADRGVPVVDYHQILAQASEHGAPGEVEFLDHVHPTVESHRQLALALIDELGEQGIAQVKTGWDEGAATARVMARVDDNQRGIAMRNLANVMQWAGKYEDAYAAAKISLELVPGDAYANFVTGDLAEKLGKKDEAMKQYKFLTGFTVDPKVAPYFVQAHYKYAGLLAEKGEEAECIRMLQRTLALKPDHQGAAEALAPELERWGKRLLVEGKGKEAVEPLSQLQQLKPEDVNVLNFLGIALIQSGQPKEAIPHLKKVLEASPANAGVHNNLASAYAQVGDKDRAAMHFTETINLAPGHISATLNLGELNLEEGDLETATAYFIMALKIQPGHPTATARLKQIRQRGGTP
ncbi:MAG: tetratricopeptide (TPR) repeat protein [Verrucomicrobiales bacterium]|jgi:tetratricopeptide (TPR) repeat protein